MKLLFDANLSRKLVKRLSNLFPGTAHVSEVGLERASDQQVLDYAITNGFVIISKDEDLHDLVLLHGPPPKVIWIRLGNCTTAAVETAIRAGAEQITKFEADKDASFLVLGRT